MNFSGIMEDQVTLASEDKVEFDDDTLRGEKPTENKLLRLNPLKLSVLISSIVAY